MHAAQGGRPRRPYRLGAILHRFWLSFIEAEFLLAGQDIRYWPPGGSM
jgi:hypothetical protein